MIEPTRLPVPDKPAEPWRNLPWPVVMARIDDDRGA